MEDREVERHRLLASLLYMDSIHDFIDSTRVGNEFSLTENNYRAQLELLFVNNLMRMEQESQIIRTNIRQLQISNPDNADDIIHAYLTEKHAIYTASILHTHGVFIQELIRSKFATITDDTVIQQWLMNASNLLLINQRGYPSAAKYRITPDGNDSFENSVLRSYLQRWYGIGDVSNLAPDDPLGDIQPKDVAAKIYCVQLIRRPDAWKAFYEHLKILFCADKIMFVNDASAIPSRDVMLIEKPELIYLGIAANNDEGGSTRVAVAYEGRDRPGLSYLLCASDNEMYAFQEYGCKNGRHIRTMKDSDGATNEFNISATASPTVANIARAFYFVSQVASHVSYGDQIPSTDTVLEQVRRNIRTLLYIEYGITVDPLQEVAPDVRQEMQGQNGVVLSKKDYLKCILDIKASGDRLQIKAVQEFNTARMERNDRTVQRAVFVSRDLCAITYAAIQGVPCVLIDKTRTKATIFNAVKNGPLGDIQDLPKNPSNKEKREWMKKCFAPQNNVNDLATAFSQVGLQSQAGPSSQGGYAVPNTYLSKDRKPVEDTPISPFVAAFHHSAHNALSRFFLALGKLGYPLTYFDYMQIVFIFRRIPSDFFTRMDTERSNLAQVIMGGAK